MGAFLLVKVINLRLQSPNHLGNITLKNFDMTCEDSNLLETLWMKMSYRLRPDSLTTRGIQSKINDFYTEGVLLK